MSYVLMLINTIISLLYNYRDVIVKMKGDIDKLLDKVQTTIQKLNMISTEPNDIYNTIIHKANIEDHIKAFIKTLNEILDKENLLIKIYKRYKENLKQVSENK